MFQGTYTAIITPFQDVAGPVPPVDYKVLAELVEWQIESGVDGLVLCGTTGEAATLETEEKIEIFRRVKDVAKGRTQLIAGTGTNSTVYSVELTRAAKEIGMDGVLTVAPYYNKPTQEGLYQHFKTIAEQGELPVVLYNIPGRSSVDIAAETFGRLSQVKNIVAVKEASGSIGKLVDIFEAVGGKMTLLAGDDNAVLATMASGGKGVITATGSVLPREMCAIVKPALSGDFKAALKAQVDVLPAIRALFTETNPAPAKAALKMMKKIPTDRLRLPLVPVTEKTRALLSTELRLS